MINIRRATFDDALPILEWRNDPVSRAMSRSTGVVERDGHLAWFGRALHDPDRVFFIGEHDGERFGMVRFDRHADGWEISINLAPKFRGRGLGSALLRASIDAMEQPGALLAEIKRSNAVSLAMFARRGFDRVSENAEYVHMVLQTGA